MTLADEVQDAYRLVIDTMANVECRSPEERMMMMAAGFRSAWAIALSRHGKLARAAHTKPLNDLPAALGMMPEKEASPAPTTSDTSPKKEAGEGNRVGGGSSQEQCSGTSISFTTLTKPLSESDGRTGIDRIPPWSNPAPYGGGTVGGDKPAIVERSAHAPAHARAPAQPVICPYCSRPLPDGDGVLCGGRS